MTEDTTHRLWRTHARSAPDGTLATNAGRLIWQDLLALEQRVNQVMTLHAYLVQHDVLRCDVHRDRYWYNGNSSFTPCRDCYVVTDAKVCESCRTPWPCATVMALYPGGPPDEEGTT